ncbi:unnamed protein product [Rotaria sp. Silwood1]|nr:unnamed protein product [Rotaria sp. Silwood1]CAF1678098.1 unnamed protein product [Rotaria sp. Silwood1]
MMIDMTLKQMELQQTSQHQEMYNPLSKQILSLMNKQLILPWTRHHHCPTSSSTRAIANSILLKTNLIENNSNVLFVLAYAFLYLITLIKDVELTISQKDVSSLEKLNNASFKKSVESISSQCIIGFNSENENFIRKLNQIGLSITRTHSTRSISSSLHLS